jgi:hydrogenase-4 component F
MDDVRGMASLLPVSSALFVAGLFAVTACPPFGPFFSELQLVRAGFATGHPWATTFFLLCLLLAFFGLTRVVFGIVDGRPGAALRKHSAPFRERASILLPPFALMMLSLALGIHPPDWLRQLWQDAVVQLYPHFLP